MAINPLTGKDDSADTAAFAGTSSAAGAGTSSTTGTTPAATGTPAASAPASTTTPPAGIVNAAVYAGTGTDPTKAASDANVANWYKSTLGRDADQAGLDYWNKQIASGVSAADAYKAFLNGAVDNGEIVHNQKSYQDANNYSGPTSTDSTTTVDDWGTNVLGRQLTAAEKAKYEGLMTATPTVAGTMAAYQQFLTDNAGQIKNSMDFAQASQLRAQQQQQLNAGTSAPAIAQYNAVHAAINPDTDTVQGQINNLLKNGNPVLDRAAALSDQKSNERGLVFSTMGAQAGQTAVLDAALQIATPDASAYNQQRLANQGYDNDSAKTNAAAQNTVNNMGYSNQLTQSNMGLQQTYNQSNAAQQQQYTQDNAAQSMTNAIAVNNASLAGSLANTLAQIKANASTSQSQTAYQQALQTVSDLNATLNGIQGNGNLDAAAVASQRNKAIDAAKSRLAYLSALNNTDYGDLIKYFSEAETT
ncbi:DUF4214 domain-containing protein [Undibacterium sp.]|uniref:DUF4214 domain-containing protein n=1 Tax=Undibacterium sp. TaxID=1914977 RepID=UPI00374CCA2E